MSYNNYLSNNMDEEIKKLVDEGINELNFNDERKVNSYLKASSYLI